MTTPYIVGIDPGGTIGYAVVDPSGSIHAYHTSEITKVGDTIWHLQTYSEGVSVVIEDFLGSGPRSAAGHLTSQQIGYIYFTCVRKGIPVKKVPSQRRKSKLAEAATYTQHVHEKDAVAHALVQREVEAG